MSERNTENKIRTQMDEFVVLGRLCDAYKGLPAVVDDDYPQLRMRYERELIAFVTALLDNNRLTSISRSDKMDDSLTFGELRLANVRRLPLFKNQQGELAHSKPDGSDWSIAEWIESVLGELGELANWHKKFRRGDIHNGLWREVAAREIADVAIYLDLLAYQLRLDLGEEIRAKFNQVSERAGCSEVRL